MPCHACRFCRLVLVVLLCVLGVRSAGAGEIEPVYAWKPNDVLRFDFRKSIEIQEDTQADEIFNDRPAMLNQTSVDVVEFKRPSDDSSEDVHKLGIPSILLSCRQGAKLTVTGVIKEDERRSKWVEIRNAEGVTGFVPGKTKFRDTREFSFDAILIIENPTPTHSYAVMHFDSAHIVMPDIYLFLPNFDEPAVQKDRGKAVLHAIEGAIKVARWNVTLDPRGIAHIETRVPKGLDEWLKETGHAAFWRSRLQKLWVEIIEKHLGLGASGEDRDMFLALTGSSMPFSGELQKIRPYRSSPEMISNKDDKAEFRFLHLPPVLAGRPYPLPYIGPPEDPKTPTVFMTFKPGIHGPISESDPSGAEPQMGSAVIDTSLKMLDWLKEAYSFETEYACDEDTQRHHKIGQKVSVRYSLVRLAPRITGNSEQPIGESIKLK